jgi:hypothetical protein
VFPFKVENNLTLKEREALKEKQIFVDSIVNDVFGFKSNLLLPIQKQYTQ